MCAGARQVGPGRWRFRAREPGCTRTEAEEVDREAAMESWQPDSLGVCVQRWSRQAGQPGVCACSRLGQGGSLLGGPRATRLGAWNPEGNQRPVGFRAPAHMWPALPPPHTHPPQPAPSSLQSVTDKLKEKLDAADKEKVEKAVQEALDWMDENQVGRGRRPRGSHPAANCLFGPPHPAHCTAGGGPPVPALLALLPSLGPLTRRISRPAGCPLWLARCTTMMP